MDLVEGKPAIKLKSVRVKAGIKGQKESELKLQQQIQALKEEIVSLKDSVGTIYQPVRQSCNAETMTTGQLADHLAV